MSAKRDTRIPDEIRHAIADRFKVVGPRWTVLAREFGCADQTVKNIVREAGLWTPPGKQSAALESATEVRRLKARELRSVLSLEALELAQTYIAQSRQPATVYKFGGKYNTFASQEIPEPDALAKQALAVAAGALIDRALALERHDAGEGEESKGAIVRLFEDMRSQTAQETTPA